MKNNISLSAFLAIVLAIVFFNFKEPPGHLIAWDQFGYYLYLPLTFIYHDLGIKNFSVVETLMHNYQPVDYFYQGIQLEDGSWVLRYTTGLSILYSPGFFTGHLFAKLLGYPMDGFSAPYQYAVLIWSVIFLIIGWHYTRKILLHFFSDRIVAAVLLLVYFGTNFLIISTHSGILLVHPYLFTLFAVMLWHTIQWHEQHKFSSAVMIGITLGLAVITRPTEMLYVIVPVLWGVKSFSGFKQKIADTFKNYRLHVFTTGAIILFFGCIQLLYWKKVTGHFFYDSYGANAGEGFDFPPYLVQFLFSYRKGWLLYTPVMLLAIAGFVYLYKNKKEIFLSSFIFFLCFLLLVSSWTYWWYASCFSQRTMTQIYSLMAVCMGFALQWAGSGKMRTIVYSLAGLLVAFNLFQSWQYDHGIIDGERMTKKYYWSVFGKTSIPAGADSLLLVDRSEAYPAMKDETKYKISSVFTSDFSADERKQDKISLKDTTINFANPAGIVDSSSEFFNIYDAHAGDVMDRYFAWLRVKAKIFPLQAEEKIDALLVINFLHGGKAYQYRAFPMTNDSTALYAWSNIKVDYLTPEVRSWNDRIQVYIWNRNKNTFAVDDVKIEKYQPFENP